MSMTNILNFEPQVCQPKGPPPENPSSITVDRGFTYMDVRWDAVSLKCPDLVYQVVMDKYFFILSSNHHLLKMIVSITLP